MFVWKHIPPDPHCIILYASYARQSEWNRIGAALSVAGGRMLHVCLPFYGVLRKSIYYNSNFKHSRCKCQAKCLLNIAQATKPRADFVNLIESHMNVGLACSQPFHFDSDNKNIEKKKNKCVVRIHVIHWLRDLSATVRTNKKSPIDEEHSFL